MLILLDFIILYSLPCHINSRHQVLAWYSQAWLIQNNFFSQKIIAQASQTVSLPFALPTLAYDTISQVSIGLIYLIIIAYFPLSFFFNHVVIFYYIFTNSSYGTRLLPQQPISSSPLLIPQFRSLFRSCLLIL